jgi:hypothetical protein
MWFKHMQKVEPRTAVLALWEDPSAFEALWDKLQVCRIDLELPPYYARCCVR